MKCLAAIFILLLVGSGCQAMPGEAERDAPKLSGGHSAPGDNQATALFTPPASSAIETIAPQKMPAPQCANLDATLAELRTAPNPSEFATQHNLLFTEKGVGVEIQLAQKADLTFYQITIRNTRGLLIEALVPLDQLCNLANDPDVLRISRLRNVTTP